MNDSAAADSRKDPDQEAVGKLVAESALRKGARFLAPDFGGVIEPH